MCSRSVSAGARLGARVFRLLALAAACMLLQLGMLLAQVLSGARAGSLLGSAAALVLAVAHVLAAAYTYPLFHAHTEYSRLVQQRAPHAHPDYLDPATDAYASRMTHMRVRQMAWGDLEERETEDDAEARVLVPRAPAASSFARPQTYGAPYAAPASRALVGMQPGGLLQLFSTPHDDAYIESARMCCFRVPLRSLLEDEEPAWVADYARTHLLFNAFAILLGIAFLELAWAFLTASLVLITVRTYAMLVAARVRRTVQPA
jgi:hypothetical protein